MRFCHCGNEAPTGLLRAELGADACVNARPHPGPPPGAREFVAGTCWFSSILVAVTVCDRLRLPSLTGLGYCVSNDHNWSMSRNISIVALMQLMLVMLGYFALGIVLKAGGYPHDPSFAASLSRVVWSPLALFLRNYGLALLFIPIVWTVFTSLSRDRRVVFSRDVWLVIGMIISIGIIVLFIYACATRYAVVPN